MGSESVWLLCVGAGRQVVMVVVVVVVVVVVLYWALEWSAVCSDRWSLLLSGHTDIDKVREEKRREGKSEN